MSKTLYLPLKKEWYEMIESLIKPEEYRGIVGYWIQRLMVYEDGSKISKLVAESLANNKAHLKMLLSDGKIKFIDFDFVRLSCGYTKRTRTFAFGGLSIDKGNKEWGAPEDDVFIIKLGKRI